MIWYQISSCPHPLPSPNFPPNDSFFLRFPSPCFCPHSNFCLIFSPSPRLNTSSSRKPSLCLSSTANVLGPQNSAQPRDHEWCSLYMYLFMQSSLLKGRAGFGWVPRSLC